MNFNNKKRVFNVQVRQQKEVVQTIIQKAFLLGLNVNQKTKQKVNSNSRSNKTPQ